MTFRPIVPPQSIKVIYGPGMVVDLKPDQKWEVAHDRVMAQDLLSRSERKAGNLKKALRDWDAGHTGDNAEGCDSGVAVK